MAGKTKAVKPWLVFKMQDGGLYSLAYRGPERQRARATAEKCLQEGKGADVIVVRGVVTLLQPGDLSASLPRDAF